MPDPVGSCFCPVLTPKGAHDEACHSHEYPGSLQDRAEATCDLRYSFTQDSGMGIFTQTDGLSIQFRLACNNHDTNHDFEAYREIHGYDFASVTKDFGKLGPDTHF